MKKILKLFLTAVIFAVVLCIGFSYVRNFVLLSEYNAESIYVYNVTDDREELNINGEERRALVSLVKIMTVYVALQNIKDLSTIASIDRTSYLNSVKNNASMAGFVSNETTTFRDLLYGTMLASGGECANSLAINISGYIDTYVKKMNRQAADFHMDDTNYKNVEGLDEEGEYTTARDVATLIRHSIKDGNFRAIFTRPYYLSTKTADHPGGLGISSTVLSKLKDFNYSGFKIIGGKSGTTGEAGLCWATLAIKEGKEYIVVVMGAPEGDMKKPEQGQIEDTIKILEEL